MCKEDKTLLLQDIESLISYGVKEPTINPVLLEYMEVSDLESIKKKLMQKVGDISQEDREWLEQFKKYD